MILRKRQLVPWVFVLAGLLAGALRAQPPEATADTRDILVYKDGDRVRGHLVQRTNEVIVFKSDRFGKLRVPAADAVVIRGDLPPEPPAKPAVVASVKPSPTPEERAEQERVIRWDRFSLAVLTARVRDFFGPWHGRLAFSNEVMTDTAHRDSFALEGRVSRKFTKDAVDLGARFDRDETNGITTTDLFRSTNSWRHEFSQRLFGHYRPTVEWNRANLRKKRLPTEYLLVQQEFGFGFNALNKPGRKIRLGVSENLFDVWGLDGSRSHSSVGVVSLFDEAEWALPWRMTLTQRGVWYPESPQRNGYEDQVELNKKLTETLSAALRHEIRRHNPDGASPDYTRLRLMLGLDF